MTINLLAQNSVNYSELDLAVTVIIQEFENDHYTSTSPQ